MGAKGAAAAADVPAIAPKVGELCVTLGVNADTALRDYLRNGRQGGGGRGRAVARVYMGVICEGLWLGSIWV